MKALLFFAIAIMAISFTSCGARRNTTATANDAGVVIDGIRWATHNVDAPGTFTQNPEDAGMFFQWNRLKGWATTGTVTGWETSYVPRSWPRENDPCPPGWRIPTLEEIRSLNRTAGEWTVINGVSGRFFGTYPDRIFLPAAGNRSTSGRLAYEGQLGYFWTRHSAGPSTAWGSRFGERQRTATFTLRKNQGFSIRCVQEG